MRTNTLQITADDGQVVEAQTPVIVSASRSTDIPAFYADWFVNRMKRGYVRWKNPFNGVHSFVSFERTRLIVFWSKNPAPLLKHLEFLDQRGLNYYFQFTLNDYDNERLEPNVPSVQSRIDTFLELSERIGKERVIWRFDPLLLTSRVGVQELLAKIERVGNQVHAHTGKLVFSFADIAIYAKVRANLAQHGVQYVEFDAKRMHEIAAGLKKLNQTWKLQIATCAESIELKPEYGIEHNKCVDDALMIRLFPGDTALMDFLGVHVTAPDLLDTQGSIAVGKSSKDKGQRLACGCVKSKDIGEYNTCPHLCEYCYANASRERVLANWSLHNDSQFHDTITGE